VTFVVKKDNPVHHEEHEEPSCRCGARQPSRNTSPKAGLPGFSRQASFSHRLQAVVADAQPFCRQPASAGLLDQWIHPK